MACPPTWRKKLSDISINDVEIVEDAIEPEDEEEEKDGSADGIKFPVGFKTEEEKDTIRNVDRTVERVLLEKKHKDTKNINRSNIQSINQLVSLYTARFDDQEAVERFREFYRSSSLRLDPLVNECAVLRMILADEASKPPKVKAAQRYKEELKSGNFKADEEEVSEKVIGPTVYAVLNAAQKTYELEDDVVDALMNNLVKNLSPKVVRYGDERVERYIKEDDASLWRNDELIVKLSNSITQLEKARQSIQDSLQKAQVEVRFNLLVHQVLNVLDKKCKDKLLLRDIALAIEEMAKNEELEIDWTLSPNE